MIYSHITIFYVLQMRNLLECDLVLVPLNVKSCHWALMVCRNKQRVTVAMLLLQVVVPSMKVMTYYDSIWRSAGELFNKCR